jgi:pimeloyl-ACP methyl ester carboxylesterase
MRISVQTVLLALLAVYLAWCGLLFLWQRKLVFPGAGGAPTPASAADYFPDLVRIWLNTSYGKAEAWFLPRLGPGPGPAPAVIFAHGNAELIDFWPEQMEGLRRLGVGVLLVEYPGYGRSEGEPSQATMTEAFVAAYDTLVARKDVDPSRIVLFGRSLGGGAVCALSAKRSPAALILLSTFTSVRSLAWKFLAPPFLVRDPFDNLTVVRAFSGPVLVAHGTRDGLIPYEHGVALARAAQRGKLITYDCGHNSCPPDWEAFWGEVEAFLREAGILKKQIQ